jgi:hypothetical protein
LAAGTFFQPESTFQPESGFALAAVAIPATMTAAASVDATIRAKIRAFRMILFSFVSPRFLGDETSLACALGNWQTIPGS